MTLAGFADLAEVVGAIAVIASLIFVGVQLRQNTIQLRQGASDAALAQASALRLALLTNKDVAELLSSELKGGATLDAADEIRLNAFFSELTYMAMNAWQRESILVSDTLLRAIAPVLGPLIRLPRGLAWWQRSRSQFPAGFATALEAAIPALTPAEPSVNAGQGAETAIAPPADAV